MLIAHQIPVPPWAGTFGDITSAESGTAALAAFTPHLDFILATFHHQIQAFFDDPLQTMEHDFPQHSRLTGDYYVGDRRFRESGDNYRMTIEFCCLGRFVAADQTNAELDYLGLEGLVHLNK